VQENKVKLDHCPHAREGESPGCCTGVCGRILEAAVDEFVEHGLDGARMQRIAERAGANKAMIYYYFSSKQELYEQVFRSLIRDRVSQVIGILSEGGEVEDKVRSLARFYCALYGDPDVMRVLLRELASGAETLKKMMRELMAEHNFPIQRFWPELIAEGRKKKRIRAVDPMHALASLVGMSAGYYFLRPVADTIFNRDATDSERFAAERPERIIDLFLNGLLER
jgi:TetR/AcrR family transcriptional regulator